MSDKETAMKLAEAHAKAYRDESPIFDGNESLAEVMAVALGQARGVTDEDGDPLTKRKREAEEKQEDLREQLGLTGCIENEDAAGVSGDAVAGKQAELREKFRNGR